MVFSIASFAAELKPSAPVDYGMMSFKPGRDTPDSGTFILIVEIDTTKNAPALP